MQPQIPSQTPPRHHHHHHLHHHHHCFPPLIHRHHHDHHLFPCFVSSLLLCPCLLHHNHHHHHQFNPCSSHLHFRAIAPYIMSSIPPNQCPVAAGFSFGSGYPGVSTAADVLVSESGVQPLDQSEDFDLEDPVEEEEDVFVLTDEWREFFAKSEAKRRMDKQQKTKHRK